MKYSTQGYKSTSPDRDQPFNIIPSGRITMKDVPYPVLGTDNFGNQRLMLPGGEYTFPGQSVHELPLKDIDMKLKRMQKGGSTYSNGVFYANGGPVASFYVDGNGYPSPFAMAPGSGRGNGMLQDLPAHMRTGGVTQDGQYVAPFAMWPGSGTGGGMLEDLPTEMKKGGRHTGHGKKMSPQQMQMMMAAMQGQQGQGQPMGQPMGQPGMGAPIGAPGMQPQGQPGQMMPPGQPMMQMGGFPAMDNVAYSGNRYYQQPSFVPAGATVTDTTHKKVTDIAPSLKEYQHDFGQRITYPGDTLTEKQLQSYVNRRNQIFNPYFRDFVHETGDKPDQNFYYPLSDKDRTKMSKMKRTDNFLWGSSSEEGYLPPPHQYGGMADSDGDADIMKKGGHWIQGAVNPAHKGYCTPMSKSTCTGKRRAFAETMKKHHGFHEMGGAVTQGGNMVRNNEMYAMGGQFHPLAKFMQMGGAGGVDEFDPNMDPGIATQPSSAPQFDPSSTGVVQTPQEPTAPWVGNMTPAQSQQNINYGAGSTEAYDPTTGNTDNGAGSINGQKQSQQLNRRGNGWAVAGAGAAVLGAGMGIASYLSDRRDQRNLRNKQFNDRSTANQYAAFNQPGGMGDYDQYGAFRPNQNTPVRAGYFPSKMSRYGGSFAMGGSYHAGQEIEMDDAEIARLQKLGYKLQVL